MERGTGIDGSVRTSIGLLGLWIMGFIILLLSTAGLIYENCISELVTKQWFIRSNIAVVSIGITIKYFKDVRYYQIVEWRKSLSKAKIRVM